MKENSPNLQNMVHAGKKKTIRMNDSARDLIYEKCVEELMKDKELEKKCTGGKKIIMERNI